MTLVIGSVLALAGALSYTSQQVPAGSVNGAILFPGHDLEGAVVYLVAEEAGVLRPPVDPPPVDPPVIDQRGLRFVPEVLAVLPGTNVEFRNSDPILHNVFSPEGPGDGFDLGTYPRPDLRTHRFGEAGVHTILCHVHPDMVAFVVVVPTPFYRVLDDSGRFRIEDISPGAYTLRVWHRFASAPPQPVVIASGRTLSISTRLSPGR